MKDKTIDFVLRATWQAVSRMYNEQASKYSAPTEATFPNMTIRKPILTE